jgi:hypothetical protein
MIGAQKLLTRQAGYPERRKGTTHDSIATPVYNMVMHHKGAKGVLMAKPGSIQIVSAPFIRTQAPAPKISDFAVGLQMGNKARKHGIFGNDIKKIRQRVNLPALNH